MKRMNDGAVRRTLSSWLAVLLLALAAGPVAAEEAGDWLVRVGGTYVDPKSDNGDVVEVDGAPSLTFEVGYMVTDNWAVELLAAWPFEHDINLAAGGTEVASTKHLPPTLYAVYHFNQTGRVQPYLGGGLNYTIFFDEDTTGPLAGADLELDPSFGVSVVAGVDFTLNERWFANASVRYINIETDAELDGADLETVEIDPICWGLNIGYRF